MICNRCGIGGISDVVAHLEVYHAGELSGGDMFLEASEEWFDIEDGDA